MRIRRIRLVDFRGVKERELAFDGAAVTIVQGPNEIGKSSLAEAIDILFEYKDDSRARRVRALKPVDRDVGTEIELDIESGPYVFTYKKRFNKGRSTELVIHAPTPENLTGREAHDRALVLLEETLDVALWKALRIHQGTALRQASVEQSPSLANALDHASGESSGGSEENESLFDAIAAEYQRYFTSTGRERRAVTDPRRALDAATERVDVLRAKLDDVERDVERCARLADEVRRLASREEELRRDARKRQEELAAVEALRERSETGRARWEAARESVELVRQRCVRRKEQVERLEALEGELVGLRRESVRHGDAERALQVEREEAEESLRLRRAEEAVARARAELARVDFEHWSDRDELEELSARQARVREAREAAADAQAILTTSKVTAEAVDRIRDAFNELLVTRALVQSKSPTVQLEGLADLVIEVGGERVTLASGATREDAISSLLEFVLPGLLKVSIQPGQDFDAVRRRLDDAHAEYLDACAAIGVDDLETALELLSQRQRAEAKVAERDRAVEVELGGERWNEQTEARQSELKGRVFGYLRERDARAPMPDGRESALNEARGATLQLDEVSGAVACALAYRDAIRDRGNELRRARDENGTRLAITEKDAHAAREALLFARDKEGDDVLETALAEAIGRERELRGVFDELRGALERSGPESIAARAANAEAALATLAGELRGAEIERVEVSTRLKLLGEEGLAERFDQAESERQHLARELERIGAHARSAALLYDTMRIRRDEARRAYLRPLRERIEQLGRIVYGPGFGVELDEDLRVRTRTLDGRTLPFESLSTGAREQIGVISRLACAMIVSGDASGVPVILDDALGYSDPERLKEMGAVLAVAGRHAQVILLTSVPDRYLHVGGAQVHRLE